MNTTIYGRLTRDPELKTSQTGTQYTMFTVATQMPVKDANGNGRKTLFVTVTAFGKQGDNIRQWFRKGSRIVVDGNINDINIGQGQNGQSYLNIYVNMSNFHIVDTKAENEGQPQQQTAPPQGYAQPQQTAPPPQQQQSYAPPQQGYAQPPQQSAPWGAATPQQTAPPPQAYANAPY